MGEERLHGWPAWPPSEILLLSFFSSLFSFPDASYVSVAIEKSNLRYTRLPAYSAMNWRQENVETVMMSLVCRPLKRSFVRVFRKVTLLGALTRWD